MSRVACVQLLRSGTQLHRRGVLDACIVGPPNSFSVTNRVALQLKENREEFPDLGAQFSKFE